MLDMSFSDGRAEELELMQNSMQVYQMKSYKVHEFTELPGG